MASQDEISRARSQAKSTATMGPQRIELLAEKEKQEVIQNLELTPEQVEEIRICFGLFDVHGNGAIQGIELQKVAASVGRELTEEDVSEIIAEIDIESKTKGEIDFIDFLNIMGKASKEPLQESDIQHVFQVFDTNSDEFITPEDMHLVFLKFGVDLTPQELNVMFEEFDQDRDGLISYDELRPVIEKVNEEIMEGIKPENHNDDNDDDYQPPE